ncbi:hypothetical protein Lser_V15G44208 [Lactuca serriola]
MADFGEYTYMVCVWRQLQLMHNKERTCEGHKNLVDGILKSDVAAPKKTRFED